MCHMLPVIKCLVPTEDLLTYVMLYDSVCVLNYTASVKFNRVISFSIHPFVADSCWTAQVDFYTYGTPPFFTFTSQLAGRKSA
jgi:hypothetical protein